MTFDWRVAIVGLQVFSIFVTAFGFAVIKFNDFKHLHNSFEKLEKSFEDLTIKVKNNCKILNKKGVKYDCYSTGSRGYHIHLYIKDLLFMEKEERRTFRLNLITFFGAERQKASDGSPIALEGVPHWKSGKIKKRCNW